MSRLRVVVGGQYGSEAKGAATAFIAREAVHRGLTAVVRVAGPNAGHTAYDDQHRKWALRQVPVAAVVHPEIELVIGAGSEIDFPVLLDEVDRLEAAGIPIRDRLVVDSQATIITEAHKVQEGGLVGAIGSTGKGIGAARSDRLMRQALIAGQAQNDFDEYGIRLMENTTHLLYHYLLMPEATVVIEGTQGYGLGLHMGHYPQCTSSDCRAIDFLAMAGIDPNWADDYRVVVVCRTYPIRVAGNSGPLKGETSWEDLGFEPERTTVTQKIRRVGEWDKDLVRAAVIANGGSKVVSISLSMADYVVPGLAGKQTGDPVSTEDWMDLSRLIGKVEGDTGASVDLVGTGPETFFQTGQV